MLSWPSQPAPLKGSTKAPPRPEVPDCQMSPHPSPHLTPTEPGLQTGTWGPPYPASAAPGTHTVQAFPHPSPGRLPYRSTPNTVHPGPGSGGGTGVSSRTEAASFLATWGSAWQERAW